MKYRDEILNCRKCYFLRIAAILLWSVGLVVLSLLPNGTTIRLAGIDKFFHVAAYALTSWLACRALLAHHLSLGKTLVLAMTYAFILGFLLELLQGVLTTSRHSETADVLANLAGAVAGSAIFCLQQKVGFRHHGK